MDEVTDLFLGPLDGEFHHVVLLVDTFTARQFCRQLFFETISGLVLELLQADDFPVGATGGVVIGVEFEDVVDHLAK